MYSFQSNCLVITLSQFTENLLSCLADELELPNYEFALTWPEIPQDLVDIHVRVSQLSILLHRLITSAESEMLTVANYRTQRKRDSRPHLATGYNYRLRLHVLWFVKLSLTFSSASSAGYADGAMGPCLDGNGCFVGRVVSSTALLSVLPPFQSRYPHLTWLTRVISINWGHEHLRWTVYRECPWGMTLWLVPFPLPQPVPLVAVWYTFSHQAIDRQQDCLSSELIDATFAWEVIIDSSSLHLSLRVSVSSCWFISDSLLFKLPIQFQTALKHSNRPIQPKIRTRHRLE